MAKLAKTTLLTTAAPQKETAMEKTTRIARRMTREDAEKRQLKAARLRSDRVKMQADETAGTILSAASSAPKR
ncbi:MAG: hypothetical protein KC439_14520 [Yoonia sp.]|nr:hypothetical protein [Yoonia sp.]